MTKKLLVVMLVLGISSTASAGLQISVNGEMEPVDTEITLLPSQTAILDIWTDADILPTVGEGYFALVAKEADGTISGGAAQEPYASDAMLNMGIAFPAAPTVPLPVGEQGAALWIFSFGPVVPAGAVLYDGFEFHCEWAVNDAVVKLYATDFVTSTLIDSVVIHQVPEPATIALLGLGSLFLRRRRK